MDYKYSKYDLCYIYDINCDLYEGNHGGHIKVMSGVDRKGLFFTPDELMCRADLAVNMNDITVPKYNGYMSLCSFRTPWNGRKENVIAVNFIAVDVDFRLAHGQWDCPMSEALKALELACLEGFPRPTYVEYSRNFRLIYKLENPYIMPSKNKIKREVIKFLERISKCLAEKLNDMSYNIYFNASYQRVNSFMRIPTSYNVRKLPAEQDGIAIKEIYDVNIMPWGWSWDIDKLAEEVLPPKGEWYDAWKARSEKERIKRKNAFSFHQGFCVKRLKELEELQNRGWDRGHRELMCMFYWLTCKQAGLSDKGTMAMVERFNSNFKQPLKNYELKSAKPSDFYIGSKRVDGWKRKYKDETIRLWLGLGNTNTDLFTGEGLPKADVMRRYRERKYRKEHHGLSKQEIMFGNAMIIESLRRTGCTWAQAAKAVGVCEKTARNLYNRFISMEVDEKDRRMNGLMICDTRSRKAKKIAMEKAEREGIWVSDNIKDCFTSKEVRDLVTKIAAYHYLITPKTRKRKKKAA